MEIYTITKTRIILSNGYYNEKDKEKYYKNKDECSETIGTAFISYFKAAKYIRELLEKENEEHGGIFDDTDMEKWNAFFIGFHHGCRLVYKQNPIEQYLRGKDAICDRKIIKYKIETLNLDFEVLDETLEIFKELA